MSRSLVIIALFLSSVAIAGDFFPMPVKRLTYEFGPAGANLPKSGALTIETSGWLKACDITALNIVVDDASITVPKSLLEELGTVNLDTLNFHATPGATYLELQFQRPGNAMGTATSTIKGKYTLVIIKGKLTELRTETTTETREYKRMAKQLQPE